MWDIPYAWLVVLYNRIEYNRTRDKIDLLVTGNQKKPQDLLNSLAEDLRKNSKVLSLAHHLGINSPAHYGTDDFDTLPPELITTVEKGVISQEYDRLWQQTIEQEKAWKRGGPEAMMKVLERQRAEFYEAKLKAQQESSSGESAP